jgi:polysaccharide biosynthesis/export protein
MVTQQMIRSAARVFLGLMVLLAAFAAAQDGSYRLQPEDVIRIQVYNEPQIGGEFEIGKDGNVSAPFVGIIRAEGKSTTELEQELRELYIRKLRLRDPIVSVTISRFRLMRASVTGMVNRAGIYTFREGDTLLTLVAQAGGAIDGRANLKRARLRRSGSSEEIPVDLEAIMHYGDTSQNYTLRDGDELIIPEDRESRVVLVGAIQQPGAYPFTEGMRVADAISLGRGEIRNITKMSGVRVIRKVPGRPGQFIQIKTDMVRFLTKNDYAQNIELEKGDIVWVPSTKTPQIGDVSAALNAAFFLDRFFGIRPLSFIR